MYENIRFINGGKFTSRGKWNHTCRTIDSTELIIVLSGEVNMFVEDERLSLHAGEVLRILPGELHGGFKESENLSFFWLHFVGAELSELPPRLSKPKNQERTKTLAKELLHYDEEKEYPRECCDSLIKVLLAEMSFGRTEGDGKVVSEIKEYIRRNKESQIKVSEIAEKYNYNEDYLNRLFKSKLKVGLKSYIDSVRIEAIKCDLLMNDASIAEIAAKYGFDEYKYLLKFFKYHEGISPSKYREAYYGMHTNQK
jgi:AraC-like DNA-binding protein